MELRKITPASIILCSALLLIFSRLTQTAADPDLFGYLTFGRAYWQEGSFPWSDPFSYLPTQKMWIYHEWLTGVIYFRLSMIGGGAALQLLKYVVGCGTGFLIYAAARHRGASTFSASLALVLITPLFAVAYSPVRAQIFTNLFLVLSFYSIARYRASHRMSWFALLIPVHWLWLNMHGGFVVGLGAYFLFAALAVITRRDRPFFVGAFFSFLLLSFCSPYGFAYWKGIILELSANRSDVPEWSNVIAAISNSEYGISSLVFLVLFGGAIVLSAWYRRLGAVEQLLLLGTGLQGVLHVRHQAIFYVFAGILLPEMLDFAWERLKVRLEGLAASALTHYGIPAALFVVSLFGVLGAIQRSPLLITTDENYPSKALSYLRASGVPASILTELDWGSYITWELYPKTKVAIDGRYTTVFEPELLKEYFNFMYNRNDAAEFLRKYEHQTAVLRTDSAGGDLLLETPGWKRIYRDETAEIFRRDQF